MRGWIEIDALTLWLDSDLNTVEFAVQSGVYAIDFLNPAPNPKITSVGQ
jgi:hypothetical protein